MDPAATAMTLGVAITSSGNLVMNSPGTMTIATPITFGGVDGSWNNLGYPIIHQGTVQVSSGGSLTNMAQLDLGDTYGETGTLALSGGIVTVPWGSSNWNIVGIGLNGGTGVLTLAGNSLFDATANAATVRYYSNFGNMIAIGAGVDPSGTHPSVGAVTVGGNSILRAGNGTAAYYENYLTVGEGGGVGTLTITGSALVQTDNLYVGSQEVNNVFYAFSGSDGNYVGSGGAGTVYLSGGTLAAPGIRNDPGATGNIYFNGGTFQNISSSYNWIYSSGTLNCYIQAGGAVFTNLYSSGELIVNEQLQHDNTAGAPAVDGGLTKNGGGMLWLNNYGPNTYTGPTTVNGGTLEVYGPAQLPNYGTLNKVSVAGGATLAVVAWNGTYGWNDAQLSSLAANASWGAGATLALDTGGGNATFGGSIAQPLILEKVGYNNLTLSGTNTYTGGTIVSSGTLQMGMRLALGSTNGSLAVNSGAAPTSTARAPPWRAVRRRHG